MYRVWEIISKNRCVNGIKFSSAEVNIFGSPLQWLVRLEAEAVMQLVTKRFSTVWYQEESLAWKGPAVACWCEDVMKSNHWHNWGEQVGFCPLDLPGCGPPRLPSCRGSIFSLTRKRTVPKKEVQTRRCRTSGMTEDLFFFLETNCFCASFALRKWWSSKVKKRSLDRPVGFGSAGIERKCGQKDIVFG